jgi:hypothetical protein
VNDVGGYIEDNTVDLIEEFEFDSAFVFAIEIAEYAASKSL